MENDELLNVSWGKITMESAIAAKKIVVHVFNHDLQSDDRVARNIIFVRSRLRYAAKNIPTGYVQHVMFDDRGQEIAESSRQKIKSALRSEASFVTFISDGERPPGLD